MPTEPQTWCFPETKLSPGQPCVFILVEPVVQMLPRTHPWTFRKAHPPWQGQGNRGGREWAKLPPFVANTVITLLRTEAQRLPDPDGSHVLSWLRRAIRALGRTPPGLRASARVRLILQTLTFP